MALRLLRQIALALVAQTHPLSYRAFIAIGFTAVRANFSFDVRHKVGRVTVSYINTLTSIPWSCAQKKSFGLRIGFQNFLRSAVVLSEREPEEMPPMLQSTFDTTIKVSNFDFNLPASPAPAVKEATAQSQKELTRYDLTPVQLPIVQSKELTRYDLTPVPLPIRHPLIIDSETPCTESECEVDSESMKLRAELRRLFPQDAQLRKLLYPIMKGEAVTERRRLELEACLKYPHVLDLQEAFVKRELGDELTEFEELLLRRMDGAVDFEVSQQD